MNFIIRNIAYILILAALPGGVICMAQEELREEVSIHVDRNYYLVGDEIFFAVYCTEAGSGLPSRISVVANVELMNHQGELLERKKILLENGSGSGSLQIPRDLNSGEHIIRSYTSWMRNFGPGTFHYTPVLIIHPAKKYMPKIGVTEIQDSIQYTGNQGLLKEAGVQISGLKEAYNSRDSIVFTLEAPAFSEISQSTALSLSIARSSSQYPFPFQISESHSDKQTSISGWNDLKIIPDMKGIQLSGTITRPGSGEAVINRDVLLSFIDSITEIYSVKSDGEGRFHFDLNGMHGRKDLIIQVPGEDQNILISIEPDRSMEQIPEHAWVSLNRSKLARQYREMLLEKQLSAAYGLSPDHHGSLPQSSAQRDHLPFYGESDHEIIMGSYVKLPVMEEVFRELGKRIFLSRDEGNYKALILDLETNRIIGEHPFYFIDGIPFFDSEKLLGLDPSLIKSISLKSRKYFMGDLVMDGIIDIRSNKGDAALVDFPRSAVREYFQGFQEGFLPALEYDVKYDLRTPMYKTTLLFRTQIQFEKEEDVRFRLIAPDSKGKYTIAIRGITSEGIRVQQDYSFEVH